MLTLPAAKQVRWSDAASLGRGAFVGESFRSLSRESVRSTRRFPAVRSSQVPAERRSGKAAIWTGLDLAETGLRLREGEESGNETRNASVSLAGSP